MHHNDFVDAVKEYLRRYREFSQYVINVKTDITECEALLQQEAAPAASSLSPTGGCGGGETISQEERIYMQREALKEKIRKYQADLQQIEPLIKRLNRSMESLASINETDAVIVRDRYIDGASWESTARHTCCSVGFCRKRAREALKMLTSMIFGPDAIPFQTSLVFFKKQQRI